MSDVAIKVDGVGKRYRLGGGAGYRTLRETVRDLVTFKRSPPPPTMWALKDVSFSVNQGEVVGIIGRNGAGKSTLLKVLSRITSPTEGTLAVTGRLASLLEVGTGFHPELSGRENVYLNGGILGMTRSEIRQRFDEIVAFAEVEKFIDTPVKHYSSGMYLRLAFAVAAHLEPEILIVDEVLAVGDASFQRKCLAKMEDVGKGGRTVLFVSHSMPAITRLCPRTVLLDRGHVVEDGPTSQVVGRYLHSGLGTTAQRVWEPGVAPGDDVVSMRAVRVVTGAGDVSDSISLGERAGLQMDYQVHRLAGAPTPNFHIFSEDGSCIFVASDTSNQWRGRPKPPGMYRSTAWIPANLLNEGSHLVLAAISTMDPVKVHAEERDAVAFQAVDNIDTSATRVGYGGRLPGAVRPLLTWETGPAPAFSQSSSRDPAPGERPNKETGA